MADVRRRARWAYEARRLRAALPWFGLGLTVAGLAWALGGSAWPWAIVMGILATLGHARGLDVGRGVVLGAALGGLGAVALLTYSLMGCGGPVCGSCNSSCAAICASVGAVLGLIVRPSWQGLVGGAVVLVLGCAVGLSALPASPIPLAVAAIAAGLTWAVRRL